jgi:hypothetical protein
MKFFFLYLCTTYFRRENVTAFAVRLRAKEIGSISHNTLTLPRGRSHQKDGREKIEVILLMDCFLFFEIRKEECRVF